MDSYSFRLRRKRVANWVSDHFRLPKLSVGFWLLFTQLMGCAAILYGISLYSHPIAYIIGGLGAILAIERQSHEPKLNPEQVLHYQRQIKLALSASKDPFAEPYNIPLTPAWVMYAATLRKQL